MLKNDKNHVISLRRDMSHVLWSGIRLKDGVDVQFHLERSGEGTGYRKIGVRLVNDDVIVSLVTGSLFEMSELNNKDYEHLESLGADLTVICQHVSHIRATMDGAGMSLRIDIQEAGEQLFMLYAKEADRAYVDRFDWFVDPSLPTRDETPIHIARPVGELRQQQAA